MLFDSHGHPHFQVFKNDSDEVIKRALNEGVELLAVGTNIETSRNAVTTAERFLGVWAAIGLHPIHASEGFFDPNEEGGESEFVSPTFKRSAESFDKEIYRSLAKSSSKVVAIGEIGLDYYRLEGDAAKQESVKEKQKEVFRAQIQLAVELDLPLSVHCRDAHNDVFDILKLMQSKHADLRGVIHCFTGTAEEARRYLTLGFYISFPGIITFAHDWDDLIKELSIENILVETDCPYLTPVPYRGKRNEPRYVLYTAQYLAKLKKISFEEAAKVTTTNAKKLFRLV